MIPAPITINLGPCTLTLECAADEIVARLWQGGKEIPPTVRATANSERVRTTDGALHIGRCQFHIPTDQRRAVADFIAAAMEAT